MNTTEYYRTAQAATRPHADRFGDLYTSSELDAINDLRVQGVKVADIALAAGRTYAGVSSVIHDAARRTRARQAATRLAARQRPACTSCWLVHAGECR